MIGVHSRIRCHCLLLRNILNIRYTSISKHHSKKWHTVKLQMFGTNEKCPDLRGELIHTCIALGHRKVS